MVALVLFALSGNAAEPDCAKAHGKVVCGWDCRTAFGEVECAQWPGGACGVAFGDVQCGPPPPDGWIWRYGDPPPKAECKSAFGEIACGYSCIAAHGEVRCAQTPDGLCDSAFGDVTCWDPPYWQGAAYVGGPTLPQADCVSAFGNTACGYNCVSGFGQVACAQWPGGTCTTSMGRIVCGPAATEGWERWWRPGMQSECVTAFGETACGFSCVSAYGDVACARTPQGHCEASYGAIRCFDPPY